MSVHAIAPATTELEFGITAVDVDYSRPLLASSHIVESEGRVAFIDTGTSRSLGLLLRALSDRGLDVEDVDLVILTHIHLDHAGGAGVLMDALPNAQLVVHPRGSRHMIEPSKLVAGSKAVYGEEAFNKLYGDIVGIDKDRVLTTSDEQEMRFGSRTFRFLHTEGHARHHHCIVDSESGGIFTGDSFGISYRELDTRAGEFIFPTTTPVHFDPDAAHATIDRLMNLAPTRLYLTHFSEVRDLQRLASDLHICLDHFVGLAETHGNADERHQRIESAMYAFLSERLDAHGFAQDADRRHAILDLDCDLNTQGLLHWFDQQQAR